ncbi:MAG: hypothetical protein HKUEN07_03730 [Rhodocyclaceae bacterium]|uniref:Uncharacterized protein n=1 Tax=Candidatus Desulfobacillus denitrificans TaxID=2608985 RepID=A0A809RWY7_9PROT|nr:hypothetical protein DSYM_15760 [Candidatus Desulfobacillus denitrificans]GIK46174.1 MAG: hypothetical protein BroJett012_20770 [Betaproteobacteria bacterium]GJQ53804.1 MAG: hypothetical protein HKUEN07_03730 [Rhodocyclaceae bacterium]
MQQRTASRSALSDRESLKTAAHVPDVSRSGAAGAGAAYLDGSCPTGWNLKRLALIVFFLLLAYFSLMSVARAETIVCVPATKTVAPCPSGYAPNQITVESVQQPDPYQNSLDAMPMQEMLFALCVGISGLLGFSVGVRLS